MDFDHYNIHPVVQREMAKILNKYSHVFLMEWEGSYRIPTGGKLGHKMIVWTQDGCVECVAPNYVLQAPAVPIGGHIEMLARKDAEITGAYERLVDYDPRKPQSEQRQVMIIGTNEESAAHPDGSPCRQIKSELAAWLGMKEPPSPKSDKAKLD